MATRRQVTHDTLYGPSALEDGLRELAATPLIQRLRHVRLSNIDSVDMPGIANLSRYEHVLGVCHLAGRVGFRGRLSPYEKIVLGASALLHDCTITSFGHLVEEAFQYLGTGFDHEDRLRQIVTGETPEEILGLQRQVLWGRETGLRKWARSVVGSIPDGDRLITDITEHIRGRGRMGRVISGEIDLDNIDNIFRMAFHMGLPVDREAPLRLARGMVELDGKGGEPVFCRSAADDIQLWRTTRHSVYEHLMLAPRDFAGKLMMLFAAIRAFEGKELATVDWALTDDQLLTRLLNSAIAEVSEATTRWITGELWETTPLVWMEGDRPNYRRLHEFSKALSERLEKTCLAYGIKDKRDRRVVVEVDDGHVVEVGEDRRQWLLGIGSPIRRPFTGVECKLAWDCTAMFFETRLLGPGERDALASGDGQPCLL